MSTIGPTVFAMSMTPFTNEGEVDEPGLRQHLQRLVDARVGVYLGSPGSGEGHALEPDELRRVYEIGVDVCKGKVPVHANPPEARTAKLAAAQMQLAIDAGVDVVQLYALDAGHGMIPRVEEQERFYDDVLSAVTAPVHLSVHRAASAWRPSVAMLGKLAERYPHMTGVHLIATNSGYNLAVKEAVGDAVAVYGGIDTFLQDLLLGLDGCQSAEANVCPNVCRSVIDHVLAGEFELAAKSMDTVLRVYRLSDRWSPSSARWVKMAMKVFGLPGGDLRSPYLLPGDDELTRMARSYDRIGLAAAEGLEVSSAYR